MSNEINHTPGPWHRQELHIHPQSCGTPAIRAGNDNKIIFIANLSGAYGGCSGHAQAQADARLIAAAPNLLVSLKIAESFIAGFEDDDLQQGVNGLLTEIRSTIVKAMGDA